LLVVVGPRLHLRRLFAVTIRLFVFPLVVRLVIYALPSPGVRSYVILLRCLYCCRLFRLFICSVPCPGCIWCWTLRLDYGCGCSLRSHVHLTTFVTHADTGRLHARHTRYSLVTHCPAFPHLPLQFTRCLPYYTTPQPTATTFTPPRLTHLPLTFWTPHTFLDTPHSTRYLATRCDTTTTRSVYGSHTFSTYIHFGWLFTLVTVLGFVTLRTVRLVCARLLTFGLRTFTHLRSHFLCVCRGCVHAPAARFTGLHTTTAAHWVAPHYVHYALPHRLSHACTPAHAPASGFAPHAHRHHTVTHAFGLLFTFARATTACRLTHYARVTCIYSLLRTLGCWITGCYRYPVARYAYAVTPTRTAFWLPVLTLTRVPVVPAVRTWLRTGSARRLRFLPFIHGCVLHLPGCWFTWFSSSAVAVTFTPVTRFYHHCHHTLRRRLIAPPVGCPYWILRSVVGLRRHTPYTTFAYVNAFCCRITTFYFTFVYTLPSAFYLPLRLRCSFARLHIFTFAHATHSSPVVVRYTHTHIYVTPVVGYSHLVHLPVYTLLLRLLVTLPLPSHLVVVRICYGCCWLVTHLVVHTLYI